MIGQSKHADDGQLHTLLFGEEDDGEVVGISSHVESCQACQRRLQRLVVSEAEEEETSRLLSGCVQPESPPGGVAQCPAGGGGAYADDVLEYLSPPSHPEMLGRLGRYEIERVIGAGGMGVVFKGFDTELNRPVAIKVLARHLARSGTARQRFGRESRAAAAVVHEHVVAIHNVESEGETPFLVMQYVAGESLQARVDRDGPLSAREILRIGIQAASGLAAAHEQGIVHRDIKPANILLERGVERVLLTDFGLARLVDEASLTQTGIVAGTPHYMSPEQANGAPSDHKSDLFSLGSVLYFIATGHPPFRAERAMGVLHRICRDKQRPAWRVNPDVPDELSDVIDRLLEKRPDWRYTSAAAVREAMLRLLNNPHRRGHPFRSRLRRWTRNHARRVGIGLLGLLVFIISLAWWPSQPAHEGEESSHPSRTANWSVALSPGLLLELAPNEEANFAASLEKIKGQLQSLESMDQSTSGRPWSDDWRDDMQSMNRRLDRLQVPPLESLDTTEGK